MSVLRLMCLSYYFHGYPLVCRWNLTGKNSYMRTWPFFALLWNSGASFIRLHLLANSSSNRIVMVVAEDIDVHLWLRLKGTHEVDLWQRGSSPFSTEIH